jgi:glycerophosphoryl diester phosphodiesterase
MISSLLVAVSFVFNQANALNNVATVSRDAYPQVIGHAGASGYVPESSLQGYDLAANLLADYSEPDLVLTKDGQFVAFHDLTLDGTTNVASYPEYVDRISTFVVEGSAITGYYAINFTLAEIQGLRLRQRFDTRTTLYDWMFIPPSLDDILSWQMANYNTTGRLVGIYPELKHPGILKLRYFRTV